MPTKGKRLHPALRWALYLVIGFLLFYLIAANIILNTGVLDSVISKKPEKTLIEWDSGWTIFPGIIHVEGFRFRGQSLKQQYQFTLGEADIRMNLFALPNKHVKASSVVGRDFSFRQRPRLTEETIDGPGVEHLPEIPGLSNPPDPAPEDIYPPKKKKKRGWLIEIGDIDLTGEVEVAVNQLRVAGAGRAGGEFNYQVGAEMHLPTTYVELDGSEIQAGGLTFVEQVYMRTKGSLGPFVPKETKGLNIFNYLLGSVSLENGTIPDIEVLNAFTVPNASIEFLDGSASFNWFFDKESVEAGSHGTLAITAQGADLLLGGRTVSADMGINAALERGSLAEGSWDLGETTLALDKVDVRLLKSEEDALAAAESPPSDDDLWWIRFTVRSGAVDLGDPGQLAVDFHFRMKNTDPLLALFFAKPTKKGGAKLPLWVRAMPDVQNVEGSGRIQMDGDGTLIEDVVIDGDDFDLIAILDDRGESSRGGLFVRHKSNNLGLDITDGKRDLKILYPKRWFLENPLFQEHWPIIDELLTDKQRNKIENRGLQAGLEETRDEDRETEPLTKAEKKKLKKESKKKKASDDDGG